MTAIILDGNAAAAAIREELAARTAALPGPLTLAVVLVGDDPASAVYVRNKEKACKKAGINSLAHRLPADTSEADVLRQAGFQEVLYKPLRGKAHIAIIESYLA